MRFNVRSLLLLSILLLGSIRVGGSDKLLIAMSYSEFILNVIGRQVAVISGQQVSTMR